MEILPSEYCSCIYCILDIQRGLLYFGQTRNYLKRSKEHLNDMKAKRHVNIRLQRLFNCNAHLMMFALEECIGNDLLNEREIFWINTYNTTNRNYGLNLSGGGHPLKALTEEAKKRKADSRRGKSSSLKGRKQSSEWIEARASKNRGQKRNYSKEHILNIKAAMAKNKNTRKKGKQVIIKDLNNSKIMIFDSKRYAEDFLKMDRDTLIHKFYKGRPRRSLKETVFRNYLITR